MNLVFDLETNGLLRDLTQIHCLCIHDLNEATTQVFNDQGGDKEPINRGITYLQDADHIIGHNVIGFDCPAISKLYGFFDRRAGVIDTLLLSRLFHADILAVDQRRKWKNMPLQLYGRHSLEAYGHRLNCYKGEFGKTADWSQWSPEMEAYMEQDVVVTTKLWQHFQRYLTG